MLGFLNGNLYPGACYNNKYIDSTENQLFMSQYYRHFRNGQMYRVIADATIEATGEEAVVYQAMYGDFRYWIRPKSNFFEEVMHEGRKVPRFQPIQGKFPVITLCGSTRFKEQFLEAQKRLTLEGYIVISVGLFGHSGDDEVWTEGTKEMLDEMHKRKIDMADEIFVINVGGYIGSSTRSEIEYAQAHGKIVRYLEG